ncbi:MAG TPA: polysaccharide deacetylase family protein [Acidimicrobiales bacterium]|nr:polysaccharide deacetylase family protein [Acidimicrobiales bacterium]
MRRPSPVLLAGAAGAAVVAHLAPGAVAWRTARCRLLPVLSGVGDAGHVALTFDDGPDPAVTPLVLDALDRLGWRATFFVLGSQVRRAPGLLDELVARGHELGVHGDAHTSHLRRAAPWVVDDLRRARDLIEGRTGRPLRWFRPPYGALAASSLVAARVAGVQPVLWTTWGRDWRPDATAQTTADDVLATWWPGATVLLHDSDVTSAPGSWRNALGALPLIAERIGEVAVGPLGEHGLPVGRWVRSGAAAG